MESSLQLQINDRYFDGQRVDFERRNLVQVRFESIGYMGHFCVVKDRQKGKMGSVEFQHHPRFGYQED